MIQPVTRRRQKSQEVRISEVLELLHDRIFACLGSTRAVLLIATVCKQWHQLVRQSLFSISVSVSNTQQEHQVTAFLGTGDFTQLHTVDAMINTVSQTSQLHSNKNGSSCSKQQESNQSHGQSHTHQLVLPALLRVAPALQQLRLHLQQPDIGNLQTLLDAATQLSDLHITMSTAQQLRLPATVRALTLCQPAMVHFSFQHLSSSSSSSSSTPLPPLMHLSALTALDLSACLCSKQHALPALPQKLKQLALTNTLVQQLGGLQEAGLTALTSLHVHYVYPDDDLNDHVQLLNLPVVHQLDSLRKLVLTGYHGLMLPRKAPAASQHSWDLSAAAAGSAGQQRQQGAVLPEQLQHISVAHLMTIAAVTHLTALTTLELGMQGVFQQQCDAQRGLQVHAASSSGVVLPEQQDLLHQIAAHLPLLQQLSLHSNWACREPLLLEQLAPLSHLTALHISGDHCRIGVSPSASLPKNLQQLHLDTSGGKLGIATVLTEEDFEPGQTGTGGLTAAVVGKLRDLSQLHHLTLRGPIVGPAPWAMLSKLQLTHLDVGGAQHCSFNDVMIARKFHGPMAEIHFRIARLITLVEIVFSLLPQWDCHAASSGCTRITRGSLQQLMVELSERSECAQRERAPFPTLAGDLHEQAASLRILHQSLQHNSFRLLRKQVARAHSHMLSALTEGFILLHSLSLEQQLGTLATALCSILRTTCPLFDESATYSSKGLGFEAVGGAAGAAACGRHNKPDRAQQQSTQQRKTKQRQKQKKTKQQQQQQQVPDTLSVAELLVKLQQLAAYHQWVKQGVRAQRVSMDILEKGQHYEQAMPMALQLMDQVEQAAPDGPAEGARAAMQQLLQGFEQYAAAMDVALGLDWMAAAPLSPNVSGMQGFDQLVRGLHKLQHVALVHTELQTVWWKYTDAADVTQAVVQRLWQPAARAVRAHEAQTKAGASIVCPAAHSSLTSLVISADAVLRITAVQYDLNEDQVELNNRAVERLLQQLPMLKNLATLQLVAGATPPSVAGREWPDSEEAGNQLQAAVQRLAAAMPWCEVQCAEFDC